MSPILEIRDVSKHFGGVQALKRVHVDVAAGQVTGIIGPNGSGKSTLVNVITGFVRPDSGSISFKTREIAGMPPHRVAALGIARTFQTARPFHELPAFKSIVVPLYSGRIRNRTTGGKWGEREAVAMDLLEEVGFERDSAVPYKLSGALPQGYLRRLELARCIALNAELIITDELFSGLSTSEVASLLPLLEKLVMKGVTLLMVEHRLKDLFKLATHVVAMEQGTLIAGGSPDEIMHDDNVKRIYMGADL
jgi:branched-chain amino acid transport system ATP-binding protein